MSVDRWLKEIGDDIRELREGRFKESQEVFASRCGISRQELSIIENGSRNYGIDNLLKIYLATRQPRELKTPDDQLHVELDSILEAGDPEELLIVRTMVKKWAREAALRLQGGDHAGNGKRR